MVEIFMYVIYAKDEETTKKLKQQQIVGYNIFIIIFTFCFIINPTYNIF